jgi:hypothetical protein
VTPLILALIALGYGLALLVAGIALDSLILGLLSVLFCVGAFVISVVGLVEGRRS